MLALVRAKQVEFIEELEVDDPRELMTSGRRFPCLSILSQAYLATAPQKHVSTNGTPYSLNINEWLICTKKQEQIPCCILR
jgi:hypothetical protein